MIIKLLECNTVQTTLDDGSGSTVNSTHSHKAVDSLSKSIADAFAYRGAMDANRPESERIHELVSFDGLTITVKCCDCAKSDGVITKGNHKTEAFNPLDDLSKAESRVQDFAAIVFTKDVRAAFVDSLEVVQVPQTKLVQRVHLEPVMIEVDGKQIQDTVTKTRATESTTTTKMIKGVATEVTTIAGSEEYQALKFTEHLVFAPNGDNVMDEVPDLDDDGKQKTLPKTQYKGQLYNKEDL